MYRCPRCNFDLPNDARFCNNCGLMRTTPVPASEKRPGQAPSQQVFYKSAPSIHGPLPHINESSHQMPQGQVPSKTTPFFGLSAPSMPQEPGKKETQGSTLPMRQDGNMQGAIPPFQNESNTNTPPGSIRPVRTNTPPKRITNPSIPARPGIPPPTQQLPPSNIPSYFSQSAPMNPSYSPPSAPSTPFSRPEENKRVGSQPLTQPNSSNSGNQNLWPAVQTPMNQTAQKQMAPNPQTWQHNIERTAGPSIPGSFTKQNLADTPSQSNWSQQSKSAQQAPFVQPGWAIRPATPPTNGQMPIEQQRKNTIAFDQNNATVAGTERIYATMAGNQRT